MHGLSVKGVRMFDGEKAYVHLRELAAEIGPRASGTQNEKMAAEYIISHFKRMGLKAYYQEFNVRTASALTQRLEVLEPYQDEVECTAFLLAGDTGPDGVEGELVYMDSLSDEYISSEIDGKIVMTSGFFRKGLELFKKHRPKGIINIGRSPRMPVGHTWGAAKTKEKYGPMPTVNVTFDDGLKLLESKAEKIRLTVVTDERDAVTQNVVGELVGSERPNEIVIIGGHYDTVPDVPGASDNAGGTAVVMELARVFKEKGTRRTMRFTAWAGEEMMLLGSGHDALRLKNDDGAIKKEDPEAESELDKVKLVVNVDVQGARIGTNQASALGPPELGASVKLLAKVEGISVPMPLNGGAVQDGVYSSDGTSYSSIGIPSVNFMRFGKTPLHSTADTIRWLDSGALRMQGAFIERFLTMYVAESKSFPFERAVSEEQMKAIERYYQKFLIRPPGE